MDIFRGALYRQQNRDIANLQESLAEQKMRLDELHGQIANQTSGMEVKISSLETKIGQFRSEIMGTLNTPFQRLLLRMSGKRLPDVNKSTDRE